MRSLTLVLVYILLGGCQTLLSQRASAAASNQTETAATIKTSTRIVLLDMIVTDKTGKPVHGLNAQDFSVQEDGTAQQIKEVEERGPAVDTSHAPRALNLPPDTYTNYVSVHEQGAANILLFDTLNTDRANLAIARQQLLVYLSKMAPNSTVALYTLDSQVHLVHGFTDDTNELIALAKRLSTAPHPMFSRARDAAEFAARASEIIGNHVMQEKVVDFLWSEQHGKEESRTIVTMQALEQLARSVAVVPGRKNLIWISGGVPFDATSTALQMQRVASIMMATQIAVYPIDVRGVAYLGADGAALSSQVFAPYGGSFETSSGQVQELLGVHETMMTMANMTGGRAHYNSNDLQAAIRDSIESGSNYYVLAYRPKNNNWNGRFRRISVKSLRSNVKVQCRPGYYAVADPLGSADIIRTFTMAMQPDVPASTTLIIKARVLLQHAPASKTQIDTLVDVHDLSLTETNDHRREANVLFVAAVWDTKGQPGGSDTATFRQQLSSEQLQSLMRTGLQLHQEMQLKPGTYQLRVGVVDRVSGKMGTIDVPLKIEADGAGKAGGGEAKP
jgi:VWFA-related protein